MIWEQSLKQCLAQEKQKKEDEKLNDTTKTIIITIVFGIIAFALTPILWPFNQGMMAPAELVPYFMLMSIIEALVFGFGIAFIALNWKNAMNSNAPMAKGRFIAIAWLLISWWPHDNFHRVNGENMLGLLYIEYAFHLTLIIAGVYLANAFWKMMKK